ncbi:MAG: metal-dependent hydrolase [Deltaproteobacteria bacterium]|nr:metal-dependent hydrolase [Deltaproteobacteria bacterium]MBW1985856.1 metal-dependent hydrolase [Deltaproteobacteria bacterium]MBW2133616.1 metal-dependent hydrolase [Deltaproteobacteria bacterium]
MTSAVIGKGVKITFYGQSAFQLAGAGSKVLIDPWLDNPLLQTPISKLGAVQLILVTHAHADHLGNTIEIAQQTGATVVAIHELAYYLAGKGVAQVIGMNKGGTCSAAGVKVTMTQALHSSSLEESGQLLPAGDPAGFVVEFNNGFRAYHAGDTAVFKDMELIRELYRPEVAMLPIGSHYVMSPAEAAVACRMLQPKFVIPMHYGTFPVLTGTPEELGSLLKDQPDVQLVVLKPGESVE